MQLAEYGGTACTAPLVDTQQCLVALCEDCSVPSNGPNGLPCFNGGTCVDAVAYSGSFTCACPSKFTGANCETGAA